MEFFYYREINLLLRKCLNTLPRMELLYCSTEHSHSYDVPLHKELYRTTLQPRLSCGLEYEPMVI